MDEHAIESTCSVNILSANSAQLSIPTSNKQTMTIVGKSIHQNVSNENQNHKSPTEVKNFCTTKFVTSEESHCQPITIASATCNTLLVNSAPLGIVAFLSLLNSLPLQWERVLIRMLVKRVNIKNIQPKSRVLVLLRKIRMQIQIASEKRQCRPKSESVEAEYLREKLPQFKI